MTDTPQPPAASPPNPATDQSQGSGSGAPVVTIPEGYVPRADLDRVESQRRQMQGELDRLKAAQTPATPTPAPTTDSGFDPDGFRRQLLTDVYSATALRESVATLRTEFPNADPSFYDADMLMEFDSPEALRAVVEADHKRVQSIVEAAVAAALAAAGVQQGGQGQGQAQGGSPLGPGNPGGAVVTGDPTIQQLMAMSFAEQDAYEKANPGVIERVLRAAGMAR